MHMSMQDPDSGIDVVSAGINLTEFYPSVEWDILDVPARKNEERYPCCEEPYPGWYRLSGNGPVRNQLIWSNFGSRYHVQRYHAPQDVILHSQLDHSLCGHHFPNDIGLLLAIRFWRKGPFSSSLFL